MGHMKYIMLGICLTSLSCHGNDDNRAQAQLDPSCIKKAVELTQQSIQGLYVFAICVIRDLSDLVKPKND